MKDWVFLKKRNLLLFATVLVFISVVLFYYLGNRVSIAFTVKGQECFPYRLWLIRKGIIPGRGEFVAFKNPQVDGKVTWIKIISGLEGDKIEIFELCDKERFRVFLEEIGRELTVKGFVVLYPSDFLHNSEVFEVFERDTKGRPLPMIKEGRIPKKKYFVTSPAVRSYDSRYWGLIDESDIIGKAYPLF